MWGYGRAEELLGRHISEFLNSSAELMQAEKECLEKGEWIGELLARKSDGKLFYAHASLNLTKSSVGLPIGLTGSFVDITRFKQVEEELRNRTLELLKLKNVLTWHSRLRGWEYGTGTFSVTP